jgi:circadian clock protein KaiC
LPSTGLSELDGIIGDGYPDKSTILVTSQPVIAKEALGYWFTSSGLVQGDFCLYITRLSVREVLQDSKSFGVDFGQKVPLWIAGEGGQLKYDLSDLASLSFNIKEVLKKNSSRRIRIVIDVLSSLLMLNQPEAMYRFLTQLFAEVKQYDAVLLATLEEGMHPSNVVTAMQQLFDGIVEMRMYEEGLKVFPLLRVSKMRGAKPQPGYFNFNFTSKGIEVSAYAR